MKNIIIAILLILVLGLGYLVLHPTHINQFLPNQQAVTPVTPASTGETQVQQPAPSPSPTPAPAVSTPSKSIPSQYVTYAHIPLLPSYVSVGSQSGWPPVFTYDPAPYSCTPGRTGMGVPTVTKEKTINGRMYCIQINDEGAAGTIYYTYTYTTRDTIKTDSGGGTLTTHFTIGFHDVDCDKIGSAEYITCHANDTVEPGVDIDAAVASILK